MGGVLCTLIRSGTNADSAGFPLLQISVILSQIEAHNYVTADNTDYHCTICVCFTNLNVIIIYSSQTMFNLKITRSILLYDQKLMNVESTRSSASINVSEWFSELRVNLP